MKHVMKIATLVASVVLAGCAVDNGGGYPSAVAQTASGTPSVAEQACLAAVSNQTNNGDVAILSSEFSEANSLVMVGVGEQRAPWRCLVSNDGVVAEVMFSGDEGAL